MIHTPRENAHFCGGFCNIIQVLYKTCNPRISVNSLVAMPTTSHVSLQMCFCVVMTDQFLFIVYNHIVLCGKN